MLADLGKRGVALWRSYETYALLACWKRRVKRLFHAAIRASNTVVNALATAPTIARVSARQRSRGPPTSCSRVTSGDVSATVIHA